MKTMTSTAQKKLSLLTITAVMMLPALAFASPEEAPHPHDLADLVARREWPLAAAAVIWSLVRVLQADTRLPDRLNIRSDLRPLAPIALSLISAVLEHVLQGVAWKDALTGAVVSAIMTMTFQDVVVKALLRGLLKVEIPLPPPLAKPGEATASPAAATLPKDVLIEEKSAPTDVDVIVVDDASDDKKHP